MRDENKSVTALIRHRVDGRITRYTLIHYRVDGKVNRITMIRLTMVRTFLLRYRADVVQV